MKAKLVICSWYQTLLTRNSTLETVYGYKTVRDYLETVLKQAGQT